MLYVRPKKILGQHFLCNDFLARKIASFCNPEENELILEVGPGKGALSRHLALVSKNLLLIEKDKECFEFLVNSCGILSDKIKRGEVFLLNEDILDLSEHALCFLEKFSGYHLVGNLPFNIGKKILQIFLEGKKAKRPKSFLVMLQKEVALQILGKERTFFTLFVELYAKEVKKVLGVPRKNFFPVPKVDATVLKIVTKKEEEINDFFKSFSIKNEESLFGFLKALFSQRRKKIRSILVSLGKKYLGSNLPYPYLLDMRPSELDLFSAAKIFKEFFS